MTKNRQAVHGKVAFDFIGFMAELQEAKNSVVTFPPGGFWGTKQIESVLCYELLREESHFAVA